MDENVNNTQVSTTQVSASTPPQAIELDPPDLSGTIPISEVQSIPTQPVQQPQPVVEEKKEDPGVNISIPEQTTPVVETNISQGETVPDSDIEVLMDNPQTTEVKNNMDAKTKKMIKINFGSKTMPFNLALILFAVVFIIGLVVGAKSFSTTIYSNQSNVNANQNTNARVSDGKNNETNAGGYIFKVPNKYYYDKTSDGLLVYDTNDSFRIFLKPIKGNYDDVANAKTSVKATLENAGIGVSNIKEITLSDNEFLVAETIDGLQNRLVAFTTGDDDTVFFIEIVTKDNSYDYDCLDLARDIKTNAKKNDNTSDMEKIKVNDNSSLIIAAVNIYKSLAS